jgi:hypothetical protein
MTKALLEAQALLAAEKAGGMFVAGSDPAIEALRSIVESRVKIAQKEGAFGEWLSYGEIMAHIVAARFDQEAADLMLRALAWKYGYRWVKDAPPPPAWAAPKT